MNTENPGNQPAADVPVMLRHHNTQRGIGPREGQWAVICEECTVLDNGDVVTLSRRLVEWTGDLNRALVACSSRDRLGES